MSTENINEENERLSPDDLKITEDIKNENNQVSQSNQYDSSKETEKKEIISLEIINEYIELINKFDENDNNYTLYPLIDKFKTKYKVQLLTGKIEKIIENDLFEKMKSFHRKCAEKIEQNQRYIQFLFDLFELLPYFYHPDNFISKISLESFNNPIKGKINFLDLFKSIQPKDEVNLIIDEMILFLFNNYNDYKSLYIENNLLSNYPSRSVFISFKFICLHLFLYEKICENQINKNLYVESLSSISRLLLQEASYYNQKFNNEFYNNAFSEFDFNTEDKVKRKLSMNEFNFLTQNLFKFLTIISKTYSSHIPSEFDFSSNKIRKTFFEQIDLEIKGESFNLLNENQIFTYTYYIFISFICEIIAFIYTNFLYFNNDFTSKNEFHFTTYDPYFIFTSDWKNPLYHMEFLSHTLNEIFLSHNHDIIKFVETFTILCDLKNQYIKEYESVYQKNSNNSFFIIQPVNSVGLSSLIWMTHKQPNTIPISFYLYSPLYIFDIFLPLIASLLKAGHSLRYIAIEWLIELTELFGEELVPSMKSLQHYSYDDIFNDILDFVGSGESDSLRRYVNGKLKNFINVLSNTAKQEFFDYFIDTALIVSEEKNLNDDKISYFIQIIKNVLTDNLNKGKLDFFNENFVKKIIKTFAFESYDKIFIFEIIETIAQSLNFIHFAILKDKRNFNGKLNVYNKDYLYLISQHLNSIVSLVDKFVKSPDEEKYKTLRLNPNDEREDIKHAFNQKKNQCILLLELINTVDSLVMKSLKELGESNDKKE